MGRPDRGRDKNKIMQTLTVGRPDRVRDNNKIMQTLTVGRPDRGRDKNKIMQTLTVGRPDRISIRSGPICSHQEHANVFMSACDHVQQVPHYKAMSRVSRRCTGGQAATLCCKSL